MSPDQPRRPEEAELLQGFMDQDGRSIRQLAPLAGITDGRWRQILKGYMTTAGHVTAVVAPAATLARMAFVLGVPVEELARTGRQDAATILERFQRDSQRGNGVTPLPPTAGMGDEIDMIYASTTMSARQKLERIRMVLELREQAAQEEGYTKREAPASGSGASVEQNS